jgi:hypothetical protein
MTNVKLPIEIMDEIVLYTCDIQIAFILKHHISQYVFDHINKKFLIFGDIHRSRAEARQGDLDSQTDKTKIIKNTFKKFWLSRKNIKKDTLPSNDVFVKGTFN